jgi:hypothetical protein
MAYEQKDGSGSLFREKEKKSEKSPDYTGTLTWRGERVRLAGWIQQDRNGKTYMSLKASEVVADHQNERPKSSGMGSAPRDMDDEVPFAPEFR